MHAYAITLNQLAIRSLSIKQAWSKRSERNHSYSRTTGSHFALVGGSQDLHFQEYPISMVESLSIEIAFSSMHRPEQAFWNVSLGPSTICGRGPLCLASGTVWIRLDPERDKPHKIAFHLAGAKGVEVLRFQPCRSRRVVATIRKRQLTGETWKVRIGINIQCFFVLDFLNDVDCRSAFDCRFWYFCRRLPRTLGL